MTDNQEKYNDAGIPVRTLGKTGLEVSVLGFGGGHIARAHISEKQSVWLMQSAIDQGIRFMDNAWEYHDGESERRMGIALQGRRDEVVLMTKVCGRDRKTADQNLNEQLEEREREIAKLREEKQKQSKHN